VENKTLGFKRLSLRLKQYDDIPMLRFYL